ncbi:type II secretion system minor pseudopilin GspJ [Pantoea sp. 1.19]|uniref:type II secretion system minor pseudopilin GspJ n=1 Tax=Pantoea sp. 1.19 TaxID=1925589 RepID=UPI000948A88A|nr:type II secretion system minor pseudopilin GspJ [Pantoea sp. 1.19]
MSSIKQRGFTLIEMLLALAIFALISLAGFQILQSVLRAQQQTQAHSETFADLVRLFSLLERDLQHAVVPSTPLASDATRATLYATGPVILGLTRRNRPDPQALARASWQQVEWRYQQHRLQRFDAIDQRETARFDQIVRIDLRFYHAGQWLTRWESPILLPAAVEITLHTARWGAVQRTLLLSGATP